MGISDSASSQKVLHTEQGPLRLKSRADSCHQPQQDCDLHGLLLSQHNFDRLEHNKLLSYVLMDKLIIRFVKTSLAV